MTPPIPRAPNVVAGEIAASRPSHLPHPVFASTSQPTSGDTASPLAYEPHAGTTAPPETSTPRTNPAPPCRSTVQHNGLSDEMEIGAFAPETRIAESMTHGLDKVLLRRSRFLTLMAPFVHQMAQFCSNDAIQLAGNWNARFMLDENVLPGTTLSLALSRLYMSLRFESNNLDARQFLVAHLDELKHELGMALHALGQSHDVFLSVH
ncbi:type III secretion system protein SctP [Burkholderia ubonensis]|uniref:type III secretion system protein SctP n=1 Tax=Burkholderia ubonensis TaxID=101571 RepID=UPI0012FB6211|nr:type III secretion system protein SctP [Burkholderia ubonensis]